MTRPVIPLRAFLTRLIWLCVLPLLLLATWLAVDSVRTQHAEYGQEAGYVARNFAAVIDQRLTASIAALNTLAASPHLDDAQQWPELYREGQAFQRSFDGHVVFAAVAEPMRVLFNTRLPFGSRLPPLPRPKGHAAVPAAVASGKPAVGDSFFGQVAGQTLVAVAVPALRDGKAAFVMLATFEAAQFQRSLDQMELPYGWSLALVDGRGETLARRAPPGLNPQRDVAASGRFVVASKVSPWSVVLEIPRDIYRAPLFAAMAALAEGILAVTLIALLVGRLASHRLGRAVAALAETPAPGAPPPDIVEIAAARRQLDAAAAQRAADAATLRQSEAQLHALAARLQAVREEERTRIAREVHDELGQLLTGLTLDMAWLRKRLAKMDEPDLRQAMSDKLAEVGQLTDAMIRSVQEIASEMRPGVLDHLGLGPALHFEAGRFQKRAGIACEVALPEAPPALQPEQATAVFRIFQEILYNVARHAGATRVSIRLAETDAGLELEVRDNGRGITPEQLADARSLGLLGMRERAMQIGGRIAFLGEPGEGTTVTLTLPT